MNRSKAPPLPPRHNEAPPLPPRPKKAPPLSQSDGYRREQSPDSHRRADSPSRNDAATDTRGKGGAGTKLWQTIHGDKDKDDKASQSAKTTTGGRPEARDLPGRNEQGSQPATTTERGRSRAREPPTTDKESHNTNKPGDAADRSDPPSDEENQGFIKSLFIGKRGDKHKPDYGSGTEKHERGRGGRPADVKYTRGTSPRRGELPPDYSEGQTTMEDRDGRRDLDPKSKPPLRKGRRGERRGGEGQGRDVNNTERNGQGARGARHGGVPNSAHLPNEEYDRYKDNRRPTPYNEGPGHAYESPFAEHEQGPPCEECNQPVPLCRTCRQPLRPEKVLEHLRRYGRI